MRLPGFGGTRTYRGTVLVFLSYSVANQISLGAEGEGGREPALEEGYVRFWSLVSAT